jgi:tight adherence protein C
MSILFALSTGVVWLLAGAIVGVFLFGAWAVISLMADRDEKPLDRLKRLDRDAMAHGVDADGSPLLRQQNKVQELLEMTAPALSKPLMPKSDLEQSQLKLKLATAGWRSEGAVPTYLGAKLLLTLVGFGVGALIFAPTNGINLRFWSLCAMTAGFGFYIPDTVLMIRRSKRQESIFYGLPDALDLMVVCVEAGLGLDAAMRRVSTEIRGTYRVLAEEFELANLQVQMGRPRREVLHDLGLRNGVDDLRSLAAILIQADRFGSSIGQALRVQSDSMRTRRKQQAEERAQKCAVKLLIPLILFIFPGVFIVLVGPAGIMIARNLGTATGSG